ncbi:MAG: GH3 auxin-responsive promoter family protein [Bacteroidales bacterium]
MNVINTTILTYFHRLLKDLEKTSINPALSQEKTLKYLIEGGKDTFFGKEHHFDSINNYDDFRKFIPIRSYEELKPYIERLRKGENYILWNQKVKWFAKSSGTSSKSKYIPITPDNLTKCHYHGFKQMLTYYLQQYPNSKILYGKALTLGGSIQIDELSPNNIFKPDIFHGDLTAILLKNSPYYAELARVPSRKIAILTDFEKKVELIAKNYSKSNITNFSGVPSWNLIMLRKILEYNNAKTISEIWPNIELFMHGGINFEPYKTQFDEIIGNSQMHYLENYNASEGYFAYQNDPTDPGLQISLNNGIFYEFIPLNYLHEVSQNTSNEIVPLSQVKKDINYAMVISTNSGLWRYLIGDCVKFISTYPYKLVITGRTQLYINAFGEELMIGNAEQALSKACNITGYSIVDYTVAPIYMKNNNRGRHQWFIEFENNHKNQNIDIEKFAEILDEVLCNINSDYEAKRKETKTMSCLSIISGKPGVFYKWMETSNKIGGQNKVPRLSNDRNLIEALLLLNK